MAEKLRCHYDRLGDIVHIDRADPYAEQESEELSDSVVARLNPETDEIENLEVHACSSHLQRGELFELPILADQRRAM
jgi:hypothetical protein